MLEEGIANKDFWESARNVVALSPVRSEIAKESAQLRSEMANQRADLIKWLLMFWIGTIVPLAGLIVALTKL